MLVPGIVDGGIDANMVPKNKAKIIPIIRPIAAEMQAYIIAKGITGIDSIVFSSMFNTGKFYRLSFVIKIFLKAMSCFIRCVEKCVLVMLLYTNRIQVLLWKVLICSLSTSE